MASVVVTLGQSLTADEQAWLVSRVSRILRLQTATTAELHLVGNTLTINWSDTGSQTTRTAAANRTVQRELSAFANAMPLIVVPFFIDIKAEEVANLELVAARFIGTNGENIKRLQARLGPNADVEVLSQPHRVVVRMPRTSITSRLSAEEQVRSMIDEIALPLRLVWPVAREVLRNEARSWRLSELLRSPAAVDTARALRVALHRPSPAEIRCKKLSPSDRVDIFKVRSLVKKLESATKRYSWCAPKDVLRNDAWCAQLAAYVSTEDAAKAARSHGACLAPYDPLNPRFVQYYLIDINTDLNVEGCKLLLQEIVQAVRPKQQCAAHGRVRAQAPGTSGWTLWSAVKKTDRAIGRFLKIAFNQRRNASDGRIDVTARAALENIRLSVLEDIKDKKIKQAIRDIEDNSHWLLQSRLQGRALRILDRKSGGIPQRPDQPWLRGDARTALLANQFGRRWDRKHLEFAAGTDFRDGSAHGNVRRLDKLAMMSKQRAPLSMHLWIEALFTVWRSELHLAPIAVSFSAKALRPSGVPLLTVSFLCRK